MPPKKKKKSKKQKMIRAVSSLLASGGTGSLMEHRKPNLIQGLARGSNKNKLKRTIRQDKIQSLQQDESRLRADNNSDYSMTPYIDRDITNLQDRVSNLRQGNRESLPAQILINMVQQQTQSQNLITGLQTRQDEQEKANTQDISGLLSQISRTQSSDTTSRPPSLSRNNTEEFKRSPSISRRERSISRSQTRDRSPSPEREEPDIGNEPPPSGLGQERRRRGFNKPISNVEMRNISIVDRRNMGVPEDANRGAIRKRIVELGVQQTLPSGRPRPIRDIMSDAIELNRIRNEQRFEEIRSRPVEEEPPTETEYTDPE